MVVRHIGSHSSHSSQKLAVLIIVQQEEEISLLKRMDSGYIEIFSRHGVHGRCLLFLPAVAISSNCCIG